MTFAFRYQIVKFSPYFINFPPRYFNWFTTAFIMYGLALSWQVSDCVTQNISSIFLKIFPNWTNVSQELTDGLFLNFLIGTLLDFPAKVIIPIYCVVVDIDIVDNLLLISFFKKTLKFSRRHWPCSWCNTWAESILTWFVTRPHFHQKYRKWKYF